jgi:endonuclease/exonuclease/phosphatase (EEP) superfamily protein YafD
MSGEASTPRTRVAWFGPGGRGRGALAAAALILAAGVLAGTLLAVFARVLWLGELAVNFRVQLAAPAVLLAMLAALVRRPLLAAALLAAALVNGAELESVFASEESVTEDRATAKRPPPEAGLPVLRVAAVNVFFLNEDTARTLGWLRDERPDVVIAAEVTPLWRTAFASLREQYPVQFLVDGQGAAEDVLLLARAPLLGIESVPLERTGTRAVVAVVPVGANVVRLCGVHATWPITPRSQRRRDAEFQALARMARASDLPFVLAGDLNVSPFSPDFQDLLSGGALASAAAGRGWQPTWPTFLPPAGLQIDHILVAAGVGVVDFRRGPRNGSDHLPIVADLVVGGPGRGMLRNP